MAKLNNITPGIAIVKENIKSIAVLRVGIDMMGLNVCGSDDEELKSAVIQALAPAKGLFLNNPSAICEISVIDTSFKSIYCIEKRFCVTNSTYIDAQQIASMCNLPYTPAIRMMLTPKMILDIQSIMCGQSNVNICEYLNFTSNALSTSGAPIYGLNINGVFVKDRRSINLTRIPEDSWGMGNIYKNIVWKSLISIAYNVLCEQPSSDMDDICKTYIKTYGSSWIVKLIVFDKGYDINVNLPSFMTRLSSDKISSAQLVNAYNLMIDILKGKFKGIANMNSEESDEYVKNLQQKVVHMLNDKDVEDENTTKSSKKDSHDTKDSDTKESSEDKSKNVKGNSDKKYNNDNNNKESHSNKEEDEEK